MIATYNGQTLLGILQDRDNSVSVRMRTSDIARGAAYSQGGLLDAKRIKLKASVKCYSLADQQAQEDAINALLPVGAIYPLVLVPLSNRYYPAEVEDVSFTRNDKNCSLIYEVSFYVPHGCSLATNETTATIAGGAGTVALSAGNERVRPRIVVSFSAVNAGASVTFTNTTTGEALTFAPTTTDTRTLDSDRETIALADGTDKTFEWVSGDFLTLLPGNNPIAVTTTACTVSSYTFYYRPRWR